MTKVYDSRIRKQDAITQIVCAIISNKDSDYQSYANNSCMYTSLSTFITKTVKEAESIYNEIVEVCDND